MRFKLRPKTQVLKTGNIIKAWHCIEILQGRKWTLLGDDGGLYKFEDAKSRDAKIEELNRELPAHNSKPSGGS